MHRRARLGVGYLPQEASIFRRLTVRQNFTGVLEALGVRHAERERQAEALLAEFRREGRREPGRAALRRRATKGGGGAVLSSPKFILFDEPFAGVDPIAVGELQRLIGSLRDRGIGVLITDHARGARDLRARVHPVLGRDPGGGHARPDRGEPEGSRRLSGEKFRLDEARPWSVDEHGAEAATQMTQQLVMTPQLQSHQAPAALAHGARGPHPHRAHREPHPRGSGGGRGFARRGREPRGAGAARGRPEHKEVEKAEEGEEGANEIDWDQYLDHYQLQGHTAPSNRGLSDEELPGYEATLTKKTDLVDHLVAARLSNPRPRTRSASRCSSSNLDDDGYFKMPAVEGESEESMTRDPRRVAFEAGVGVTFAEEVLKKVQLDPMGVAARDLRECLHPGRPPTSTRPRSSRSSSATSRHLESKNYGAIAKDLKISIDEVVKR